jgi:hypothetical protein
MGTRVYIPTPAVTHRNATSAAKCSDPGRVHHPPAAPRSPPPRNPCPVASGNMAKSSALTFPLRLLRLEQVHAQRRRRSRGASCVSRACAAHEARWRGLRVAAAHSRGRMVSSWGQRIRGLLPQRGATEDPEPRAFFPGETRGGADVPVAERACPGRHHPRRPRRRQARSMGPPSLVRAHALFRLAMLRAATKQHACSD